MKNHLRLESCAQEARRDINPPRDCQDSVPNKVETAVAQGDSISVEGDMMHLDARRHVLKKKSSIWSVTSRLRGTSLQPGPPPPPLPQIPVRPVDDCGARCIPQYRAALTGHADNPSAAGDITVRESIDHDDRWAVPVPEKREVDTRENLMQSDPIPQLGQVHQSGMDLGGQNQDAAGWLTETHDWKSFLDSGDHILNYETVLKDLVPLLLDQPPASSSSPSSLSNRNDRVESIFSTSDHSDAYFIGSYPSSMSQRESNGGTEYITSSQNVQKTIRSSAPAQLHDSAFQSVKARADMNTNTFASSPSPPNLFGEAASPSTMSHPSTPKTPFTYTPLEQQYPLFPPLRIGERPLSSPIHGLETDCYDDLDQRKRKSKRSSTRSGFSSLKRRSKASFMSLFSN